MSELDEYLDFAKELAKEAGKTFRKYFSAELKAEWKSDNTPLTIADTEINSLVINKVKERYPDHGVIGEEDSYDSNQDYVWVVDPIDGTVPFSLGMPISTFSLGLVDRSDGKTIVAVVYDPYLKKMYSSVRGKGSFVNNHRMEALEDTDLDRNYVSVLGGIPRDKTIYFKSGACADILRSRGANVMSLISQAYAAVKVAEGQLVGSVFGYGSAWDSAAVSLLVEEAGGLVTDLEGNHRRYDRSGLGCVLAANKDIHSKLLKAIQDSKVENHRN